jgi:hypothetical protein
VRLSSEYRGDSSRAWLAVTVGVDLRASARALATVATILGHISIRQAPASPLSRVGSFLFAETLRAWVGQLEDGTDVRGPNSCGETHRRPGSNDTTNRPPIADRGAL